MCDLQIWGGGRSSDLSSNRVSKKKYIENNISLVSLGKNLAKLKRLKKQKVRKNL